MVENNATKLNQGAEDDSEEENFIDVDKVQDQEKKAEKKASISTYDAMKREPKYSAAETAPLHELVALANHCHPTVRMWAKALLDGQPIDYSGDPILDFTISNFLDRVSYKDPKSLDKLKKFKERKMADYERPVNEIDFKKGEKPENFR